MDLESVGVRDRYGLLGALQHSSNSSTADEQRSYTTSFLAVVLSFLLTSVTTTVADRLRLVIRYRDY